jgi:hypothetical protein
MNHTCLHEVAALGDGSCKLATLPLPDEGGPTRTPPAPDTCASTKAGVGPTFVRDVLFATSKARPLARRGRHRPVRASQQPAVVLAVLRRKGKPSPLDRDARFDRPMKVKSLGATFSGCDRSGA